jgi:hypothetical protein
MLRQPWIYDRDAAICLFYQLATGSEGCGAIISEMTLVSSTIIFQSAAAPGALLAMRLQD